VAMGLKSKFLAAHVGSILEFAGLQDKVNHRLRTLSSGQRMRLGFAISTSVQHDIMLLDEWVGTGDAEFMARAKERMQNRFGGSKIVVLASHSIGMLRDICNKGIVLEQGRVVHAGEIGSALEAYHRLMAKLQEEQGAGSGHDSQAESGIYGKVSHLSVSDGTFVLEGWWADTSGGLPEALGVRLRGRYYLAEEVDRLRRPNVKNHYGLIHDNHGFRARFRVAEVVHEKDLAGIQVLAGMRAGYANTPLRLAPGVRKQLKTVVSE
jgi:lipopolysaccharide transport system ATP-binding protein